MEPVVPKFIDELIEFDSKNKKPVQSTGEKSVSHEPKLQEPQEVPEFPPGQANGPKCH